MAKKVTGEIVGGKSEVMNDVETVADVAEKLGLGRGAAGYTAAINGNAAELGESLEDFNNVTFAPASKGGK